MRDHGLTIAVILLSLLAVFLLGATEVYRGSIREHTARQVLLPFGTAETTQIIGTAKDTTDAILMNRDQLAALWCQATADGDADSVGYTVRMLQAWCDTMSMMVEPVNLNTSETFTNVNAQAVELTPIPLWYFSIEGGGRGGGG